jgi:hypothetical protein
MPSTFDLILVMCGTTGAVMVVGSIFLLYQGVIKLSEKSAGSALEADFKNQLKINIRNPALGLFAIGFSFFVLALYFAKNEEISPLVVTGHLKIADMNGIEVKLIPDFRLNSDSESRKCEWPIPVSTEGEISTTFQPLEKLVVDIEAPGYTPAQWKHPLHADEAKNGHFEMRPPEFKPAVGLSRKQP